MVNNFVGGLSVKSKAKVHDNRTAIIMLTISLGSLFIFVVYKGVRYYLKRRKLEEETEYVEDELDDIPVTEERTFAE